MEDLQKLEKLVELLKERRTAMLTTKQNDGLLKSRPMALTTVDHDGTLWFFNNEHSCKSNEIKLNPEVNVAFKDSGDETYISISGKASIVDDRLKMKELMNPMVKAWFPKGIDDPDISLLRIDLEKAAYWITEASKLKQVFEYTKAYIKGERPDVGKHETIFS